MTTDKVYENKEWEYGYRENDPLDGYDPYSNSKILLRASDPQLPEILLPGRQMCHFPLPVPVMSSVVVICAHDRIIPDCIRAAAGGRAIVVREIHFPPDRISM